MVNYNQIWIILYNMFVTLFIYFSTNSTYWMYCILITFNINNEKNRVSLNIYPLKYTFKRSYYNVKIGNVSLWNVILANKWSTSIK